MKTTRKDHSTPNQGSEIPLEDTHLLSESQGSNNGHVYEKITDESRCCTIAKCCKISCLITTVGSLFVGSSVLTTASYMGIFRLLDSNMSVENLLINGAVCGIATVVLGVGALGICACALSGDNEDSSVQSL